jgi:CDP-diacylglycerol--glycerol-3-phosphate 3-phosphatidyltransferase
MKQLLQLPNITLASKITILRILGVPLFILVLLYYTMNLSRGQTKDFERFIALGLFAAVAFTDAVDGYLARSRREITRLGSILDPIADKALLVSGMVLLTRPSLPALQPQFPVAFTLLVISRDVVLVAGAFVVHLISGHVRVRPRWTGKVATFFQMLCIAWALARGPRVPFLVFVCTAGFFTFVSGAHYLLDGIRQIEEEQGEQKAA